jgi:cellulose synthase (UDP-forming)
VNLNQSRFLLDAYFFLVNFLKRLALYYQILFQKKARSFFASRFFYNFLNMLQIIAFSSIFYIYVLDFISISNLSDINYLNKAILQILTLFSSLYIFQFVGYLDKLTRSIFIYNPLQIATNKVLISNPRVAIIIPAYNESALILEQTIKASKDVKYSNYEVILLYDSITSQIPGEIQKLVNKYKTTCFYRNNRRGYKAGAINDAIRLLDSDVEYILIVDSDHTVKNNILIDLISLLQSNPMLSFIQTPQYYPIKKRGSLEVAFSLHQHIFNKHICRGLSTKGSAFITGTNVLMRLKDIRSIGGLDESCLTEDLSTSFQLHARNFGSIYLDSVYAEGIAPPSLLAYYSQQLRWAFGTTQQLKILLLRFIRDPRSLSCSQWIEYSLNDMWYFLSAGFIISYYLIPIMFLLDLELVQTKTSQLFGAGLLLMFICQIITCTKERDFSIKEIVVSQAVFCMMNIAYFRGVVKGLTKKKMDFFVTPKVSTPHKNDLKRLYIEMLIYFSIPLMIGLYIGISNLRSHISIFFIIWLFNSGLIFICLEQLCESEFHETG